MIDLINSIYSGKFETLFVSVFSGIAGFFLQKRYAARKPFVHLTSLGFVGGRVYIDEQLHSQIKNFSWGIKIPSGYVNFKDLIEKDEKFSNLSAELDRVKIKVDQWLSQNIGLDKKDYINGSELSSCPLMHEGVIISYLMSSLMKRLELNFPNTDLAKIKTMRDIFGVEAEDKDNITVHLGNNGIAFKKQDGFRQQELDSMFILAYSIIKGEAKNISYALHFFSEKISHEILQISQITKSIRNLITNHAEIQVTIGLGNSGTEPRLVDPRAVLTIHYGENVKQIIIEHRATTKGSEFSHTTETLPKLPRHTNENFLDINTLAPHIFIPTTGSIECKFVSVESLREISKDLIDYYRIGGVGAEITLMEERFGALQSKKVSFSKTITHEKRREIINLATNSSFYLRLLALLQLQKIQR